MTTTPSTRRVGGALRAARNARTRSTRCWRRGRPDRGVRGPRARRGTRPVPALVRARSRSHQALAPVATLGRQVPGVHRSRRRPSPYAAHPCGRGGPGGHRHRPGRQPVPAAGGGDRAGARLRPRPGGARVGRGVLAVPARHGIRPRGLRRRRHAGAAQPLRRDARRCAQPLVAPPGAAHSRGRGRRVGRPDRLRVPRLRRRGSGGDPGTRRSPGRRSREWSAPDRRSRSAPSCSRCSTPSSAPARSA